MTKWKHKCDLEWLKARQGFLSATDIKELLPVTKSGRKRSVGNDSYLKVLSHKLVHLTEEDCISVGAAARGHILEPFAIESYNLCVCENKLFHWDDVVVTRNNAKEFSLGFSPDAMTVSQDGFGQSKIVTVDNALAIGEVKSYSPERHMICGNSQKKDLEERWQIATAMAVCDCIEHAYLIFFNPSMKHQMYVFDYTRDDLKDEISIVLEIESNWMKWLDDFTSGAINKESIAVCHTGFSEQSIIDSIIIKERINPDNTKTVMR